MIFDIRIVRLSPSMLRQSDFDEIWNFMISFSNRTRDKFEKSLKNTETVFIIRRKDNNSLGGFVGVNHFMVNVDGKNFGVIYTPWAALHPQLRGNHIIQLLGLLSFLKMKIRHPFTNLYWMAGASTYKSYLIFANNFIDYWPKRDHAWPKLESEIVQKVMSQLSDPNWDPKAGVVRRHGASRYFEGVVKDDLNVLKNPAIDYYYHLNPNQDQGDSLICLCRLSFKNWKSMLSQSISRAFRNNPK